MIEQTATEPLRVEVSTRTGKCHVWFCHAECFKAQMKDPPDAPDFFKPAHHYQLRHA
jgi:hypothetical protein